MFSHLRLLGKNGIWTQTGIRRQESLGWLKKKTTLLSHKEGAPLSDTNFIILYIFK